MTESAHPHGHRATAAALAVAYARRDREGFRVLSTPATVETGTQIVLLMLKHLTHSLSDDYLSAIFSWLLQPLSDDPDAPARGKPVPCTLQAINAVATAKASLSGHVLTDAQIADTVVKLARARRFFEFHGVRAYWEVFARFEQVHPMLFSPPLVDHYRAVLLAEQSRP